MSVIQAIEYLHRYLFILQVPKTNNKIYADGGIIDNYPTFIIKTLIIKTY